MRRMADALALAETLVIAKNVDFILPNGAAGRAAELVAAELCFFEAVGVFKKIRGVESAVAEKFVDAAVELIGSGAGDGVDDSSGSVAVFRGVIAGEYGEFLNGIDAEILTEDAAGSGVGIVIDHHAIEAVSVLGGPGTANAQLHAEAAGV